jgi:hypothetical protein
MLTTVLVFLARILWTAAVLRWGVNQLRPAGSETEPVTEFRSAVYTTLALAGLGLVLDAVNVLPIPGLGLLCGAIYASVWYAVFAISYKLGLFRALAMLPIQFAGGLLFKLIVSILPISAATSSGLW